MSTPARILLPPRPRRLDWWTAGACAGLLLGIAEIALVIAQGVELPPRLVLVLCAGAALLVAIPSGLLGLAIGAARRRPPHSELVGAVLGVLLLAPAAAPTAALAREGGDLAGSDLAALAVMLLLAAAVGVAAARVLGGLERAGMPLGGLLPWSLGAALVAIAERGVDGPNALRRAVFLLAGVVAAAGIAALVARLARPGRARATWAPGQLLALLLALVLATAFGPRLLPWLLYDSNAPAIGDGPLNVVLLGLGSSFEDVPRRQDPSEPDPGAAPNLTLIASEGVIYERVLRRSDPTVGALATLPDGGPLLAELGSRGYATAAVLAEPDRAPPDGAGHVDAEPGPAALLARHGRKTAAGGVLVAFAPDALGPLRLGAVRRSPQEITGDALRWLIRWRGTRAQAPFALYLDYEAEAPPELPALDAEVGRLVTALVQLEVAERTLLLLASQPPGEAPGGRSFRVFVRPPDRFELARRGLLVSQPIPAAEFAQALLLLAHASDAETLLLPGGVFGSRRPEPPGIDLLGLRAARPRAPSAARRRGAQRVRPPPS